MTQAFLHRDEDIGVIARFHEDDPIGVEPGEMQGRRKQVAPVEAPDDLALRPRENTGQENGRGCIVGKVRTAGNLMERAGRYAAARQMIVNGVDAEGKHWMPTAHGFHLRDTRTQLVEDGGF